jgi:hypothetical protein
VKSAFRKISRAGSLSGATKWYLSGDCLLAAKRVLYTVEYRRFYLRDIESIVVWPKRASMWLRLIPGALVAALAAVFWFSSRNVTGATICGAIACGWGALELALGPTANARIQTTGTSVDLPLVKRARSARKVLAKINAAIQADRGGLVEPGIAGAPAVQAGEETVPAAVDASGSTTSVDPIGNVT